MPGEWILLFRGLAGAEITCELGQALNLGSIGADLGLHLADFFGEGLKLGQSRG